MRYAVFDFRHYYPSGGWDDFVAIGSTFDELRPIIVQHLDDRDSTIQIVALDDNPRIVAYTESKTELTEETEDYMVWTSTIDFVIEETRDDIDLEAILANDYRHEEKRYKSHMLSPFGGSTEYSPDVAEAEIVDDDLTDEERAEIRRRYEHRDNEPLTAEQLRAMPNLINDDPAVVKQRKDRLTGRWFNREDMESSVADRKDRLAKESLSFLELSQRMTSSLLARDLAEVIALEELMNESEIDI